MEDRASYARQRRRRGPVHRPGPVGRIVDQSWRKDSDNTDRERVKYGYDRASNRQWPENTVAGTGQDEYYTYNVLYQVKTLDRGVDGATRPPGSAARRAGRRTGTTIRRATGGDRARRI